MNTVIVTGIPVRYGGKGSYILNELNYLMERGIETTLIYWSDPKSDVPERQPLRIFSKITSGRFEPVRGGKRTRLRGPIYLFTNVLRFCFFMRSLSEKIKIDAVHAQDPTVALSTSLAGMSKKTILQVHSPYQKDKFIIDAPLSSLGLKKRFRALINHPFDVLLVLLAYNLVRNIVCASEFEYDDVKGKTAFNEKVLIIRNGVDTSVFKPNGDMAFVKPPIPHGKFVVLYVGRMVNKNGPALIAAAAKILADHGNEEIFFVFVGDGPEKQNILRFTDRNKLRNILLLPWMPMKDIIHRADVFVSHVSSGVTGHGLTIIEAMSSGVPVITGIDDIKEKMFKHGFDVFFVKKDDPQQIAEAIKTLKSDEELRRTISLNARKTVESKFDNAKNMKLVEELLLECAHHS
jgi:glycosyltransferase involved in cell wall biosynthesis